MEGFWKATAIIILTVILSTAIGKSEKDISLVLTLVACCAVVMVALQYLSDVIAFVWKLGTDIQGQNPFLGTLLKISGVAFMAELTALISSDAGNSSLGKAMQLLGNAAILSLSLPLFETFFTMIQEILGML